MSNKGVWITAPATPGLLINYVTQVAKINYIPNSDLIGKKTKLIGIPEFWGSSKQ